MTRVENRIMETLIVAVYIDQKRCDPKIRKVLNKPYYILNDRVKINSKRKIVINPNHYDTRWYWGANINVQAIVGPNGSGKSSLLEIIYRIINNFSALLESGLKRNASWNLLFVTGLYAKLYYIQDGHLCCISCMGDEVELIVDDKKEIALPNNNGLISINRISQLTKNLFYTIVTNYSIQSLVNHDYQCEKSYNPTKVYNQKLTTNDSQVWISHLFHKNDGYLTPIVLNPFRDKDGNIDMIREYQLTVYRLSALLLYYQKRSGFFNDYVLDDLKYTFSIKNVFNKYIENGIDKGRIDSFSRKFNKIITKYEQSTSSLIIRKMGYYDVDYKSDIAKAAALYLIYKVLSIASKYPSYSGLDKLNLQLFDKTQLSLINISLINKLVDKIKKDKSHITIKINQVCNLLNAIKSKGSSVFEKETIRIDEYRSLLPHQDSLRVNELMSIMYSLPPSFFIPTLTIKDPNNRKQAIRIDSLSSGERQLLYTFSTYVYHIRNLLSIPNDRVSYRHINLILDESEICFHPEYQRLFIARLLSMIKSLHLNQHCAFNIVVATHSPFILSDMPNNNILYLDNGDSIARCNFVSPLAANISDILFQSFFLRNGFIGEWARTKLQSILLKNKSWDDISQDERSFIEQIGDEFLKKQIKRKLSAPQI